MPTNLLMRVKLKNDNNFIDKTYYKFLIFHNYQR
jgi:hypothetical protein